MQAQLSQIMTFGKTFSKSKLLFQILPLNRKLLQGNSFHRTHHTTLSTCKTRLMIRSIRLTTRSTLSTRFFTRSTRFSTCSTRSSTYFLVLTRSFAQYSFFHSQYSSIHLKYSSVHLQYLSVHWQYLSVHSQYSQYYLLVFLSLIPYMKKNVFGKQFINNKSICSGNMDKFIIAYESLYF